MGKYDIIFSPLTWYFELIYLTINCELLKMFRFFAPMTEANCSLAIRSLYSTLLLEPLSPNLNVYLILRHSGYEELSNKILSKPLSFEDLSI